MIQITKEESRAITIVKVLCMFGVVYIHAAIKMYMNCSPSMTAYYDLLTRVLPSFAVPGFFMCSGFLFYKNYDGIEAYLPKAKSRIRTLVVPYIYWISFTLFVTWFLQDILGFAKLFGAGEMKLIHDFSATDFARAYWNLRDGEPFLSTMWFLKDLIVCVFIAPLLYVLLKPKWCGVITMYCIVVLSIFGYSIATISISSILWFAVGGGVAIHGLKVFIWIKNHTTILFLLSTIFIVYSTSIYNEYASQSYFRSAIRLLMTIIVFCCLLSVSLKIVDKPVGAKLMSLGVPSYFIYLAHEPYMGYVLQMILKAIKHSSIAVKQTTIIAIPILYPILIILICLGVFRLLRAVMPRALSVVVGGKV